MRGAWRDFERVYPLEPMNFWNSDRAAEAACPAPERRDCYRRALDAAVRRPARRWVGSCAGATVRRPVERRALSDLSRAHGLLKEPPVCAPPPWLRGRLAAPGPPGSGCRRPEDGLCSSAWGCPLVALSAAVAHAAPLPRLAHGRRASARRRLRRGGPGPARARARLGARGFLQEHVFSRPDVLGAASRQPFEREGPACLEGGGRAPRLCGPLGLGRRRRTSPGRRAARREDAVARSRAGARAGTRAAAAGGGASVAFPPPSRQRRPAGLP